MRVRRLASPVRLPVVGAASDRLRLPVSLQNSVKHNAVAPHWDLRRESSADCSRDAACYHKLISPGSPKVPVELLGKSAEELRAFAHSLGEPAYRGAQIYHALYAERRFACAAMTNLPAALRARLEEQARITLPRVQRRFPSADGSVRSLLSLAGEDTRPAQIEAVF